MTTISILIAAGFAITTGMIILLLLKLNKLTTTLNERDQATLNLQQQDLHEQRSRFDEHQFKTLKMLQDSLQKGFMVTQQQVTDVLSKHADSMGKRVDSLTETT